MNEIEIPKGLDIPRIDDYLGTWAISEKAISSYVLLLSRIDLASHVMQYNIANRTPKLQARQHTVNTGKKDRNVRVISVAGTMMKGWMSLGQSTSTVAIRKELRNAKNDSSIDAGLLKFDTPGGTVAGTQELADDVMEFQRVKPLESYIEDQCCSAGYWVASQTGYITMNRTGITGSLGTILRMVDSSVESNLRGRKVLVVSTGDFKGMGVPGTEITAEQLGKAREMVEALNEHFKEAVGTGRRMRQSKVDELFTGEVFVGNQAKELGLVDEIGSLDSALRRFAVSDEKSATVAEIKEACPGASNDFVIAQIEAGVSIAEAGKAWMEELTKRNEELVKKVDEEGKVGNSSIGVHPNRLSAKRDRAEAGGSRTVNFREEADRRVGELMASAEISRKEAIRRVMGEDEEFHRGYLSEMNTPQVRREVDPYESKPARSLT